SATSRRSSSICSTSLGSHSSLGFKGPVQAYAPTQDVVSGTPTKAVEETTSVPHDNVQVAGFDVKPKEILLDRWLDNLVKFSSSDPMFLFILTTVLAWPFSGIRFGRSTDWTVTISDAQAILSYIFDSLLMCQQLNEYEMLVSVAASLQSRNVTNKRMLRKLLRSEQYWAIVPTLGEGLDPSEFSADLPMENWLDLASHVLGHIGTICLYRICIFIWIGFGPYCNWSDRWQLYINSSTSALMVLTFAFGANVPGAPPRLHYQVTPNPTITIPAPKMNKLRRTIAYHADLVDSAFESVKFEDKDMLADMCVSELTSQHTAKLPLSFQLSVKMSKLCSHEWTVMFGVVAIIGLIAGASAMRSTVTGQLFCNVPPSLIESSIMMVLITGHNITEGARWIEFRAMYLQRLKLISVVD
ncbi:hypothetical protein DV736_g6022, partial [Chaetothyriales sp. CBS 134916]